METVPNTASFRIIGRRPAQAEAEALAALDFPRTAPGKGEVRHHVKWAFAFLGIMAACFLLGMLFRRYVLGVLMVLCSPVLLVLAICELMKLLSSGRKKKPEKALDWYFKKGLIGDDAVSERFGKTEYAADVMKRCIPAGRGDLTRQLTDYVEGFRAVLGAAADETTLPLKTEGRSLTSPAIQHDRYEETELWPGAVEVRARYLFIDRLSYSDAKNNTHTAESARIALKVTQTMVRCGKFWTPFDPFPRVERGGRAAQAENGQQIASEAETWDCPCGKKGNPGNFCIVCGRPRQ